MSAIVMYRILIPFYSCCTAKSGQVSADAQGLHDALYVYGHSRKLMRWHTRCWQVFIHVGRATGACAVDGLHRRLMSMYRHL